MTPLVLSLLAGCFYTAVALAFKALQRRSTGAFVCLLFLGAAGGTVAAAFLLAQGEALEPASTLLGAAAGLLTYLAFMLTYASLGEVPVSVAWTVLNLGLVLPVVLGLTAFGEAMSPFKAAGFALFLLTVGLFAAGLRGTPRNRRSRAPEKAHGGISGRAALMCTGMLVINGSLMLLMRIRERLVGPTHQADYVLASYAVPLLMALAWLSISRPRRLARVIGPAQAGKRIPGRLAFASKLASLGIVLGAGHALGTVTLILAQGLPSYEVFPICNGIQVTAIPVVSYFLFGERLRWPSMVGLGTGLGSMVMLGWGAQ
jgi:multidrug transporter EmrE-like cation transporter